MTPERWDFINRYAQDVFGGEDDQLATLMDRAVAAGLPPIAVSPDVGKLLQILASMTSGRLAVELGTLGGYSGIHISRGLAPDGKLLTVEYDEHHADFAQAEFDAAGLTDRVEIIRGPALGSLPEIAARVGERSVDLVFIDAAKGEYLEYFRLVRPLIRPGGLLVADNVYGTGAGWIDEGHGTDDFNRAVAADDGFISTATPMREGVLIAMRLPGSQGSTRE